MKKANPSIYKLFIYLFISIFIVSCSKDDPDSDEINKSKDFVLIVADVTSGNRGAILKIDPQTGDQEVLSENGRFQGGPQDVAIDENNVIYTTVSNPPEIVRIDPVSGNQNTISAGGYLNQSMKGIAVENSEYLLVAKGGIQYDTEPRLLRINKNSGEQEVLSEGGQFWEVNDVAVSKNGDIYVSGQGVVTVNNINYVTGALFRINPISGIQTEIFKSMDVAYNSLDQIDFDKTGNVLAIAFDAATRYEIIIRINLQTGLHDVVVPVEKEIYYGAIACTDNGDIFVVRTRTFSGNNSICRFNNSTGILDPFSSGNYLELPTGMDILYSE